MSPSQPAPEWLAELPGVIASPRESLLLAIVVVGLLIQIAHQFVLMLHTRLYTETGHLITRDLRLRSRSQRFPKRRRSAIW